MEKYVEVELGIKDGKSLEGNMELKRLKVI